MELALRLPIDAALPRDEAAAAVADAGYHAVLLDFTGPGGAAALEQVTGALAAKTADVFDGFGLELAGLAVAADLAQGEAAAATVSLAIRLARHFGTGLVVVTAGAAGDWTEVLEPLLELADEADEAAVELVVVVAPGQAIDDLDTAELLLDAVDAEGVSLAVDPLQLAADGGPAPADLLARVGDAVSLVCFGCGSAQAAEADYAALCESLAAEAPDAVAVVDAATPAATSALLARLL